ncbi:hypothetical protein BGX29_009372 [Mortierella sp. GBA35]|nr:hypothetical protein BGX29_009372 [Mortierella sp. GBA35]
MARPGTELRTIAQLYAASIPDVLSIMSSNSPRLAPFVNSTYSKSLADYYVIEMQPPCPPPAYTDIHNAVNQLTCSDRKLVSDMFNLRYYNTTKVMSFESKNCGGNNGGNNGGNGNCVKPNIWADKCTSTGTFCGSDLFGCHSIDDGLYSCTVIGEKPKLLEICPLGGCVALSPEVCGSEFPSTCNYDEGSLYFCKSSNTIPILLNKCVTGSCPKGATECPLPPVDDTCLCKVHGPICGATFASSCRLEPGSLYFCNNKGEEPKILTKCESNLCKSGKTECEPKQPTPGNECKCPKSDITLRGSFFPSKCELEAASLYTCVNKGDAPTFLEKRPSNGCPNGADKCDPVPTPGEYKCKSVGKICGSSFPVSCGHDVNSVYDCPGENVLPVFVEKCGSDVCPSGGTHCEPTPIPYSDCECQAIGKICGSAFPLASGLESATLYSCERRGELPKAAEKCASNSCSSGASACDPFLPPKPDDCKCKDVGKTCGASFPASCGYPSSSLFTCADKGLAPASYERCEYNRCPAGKSDFPVICGFDSGSLYTCSDMGLNPSSSEECPSNSCKAGNSACDPLPPGPDDCKCKELGKICGATFLAKCGFDAGFLYTCADKGLFPSSSEKCASNSCPRGASACEVIPEPDLCLCQNRGPICGSTFPASCNLDTTALYLCGNKDEQPKLAEKCPSGECKSGNTACEAVPEPNPCLYRDIGDVCGSTYVSTCGFDAGSLYNCAKEGDTPKLVKKCESNSCRAGGAKCDDPPIPEKSVASPSLQLVDLRLASYISVAAEAPFLKSWRSVNRTAVHLNTTSVAPTRPRARSMQICGSSFPASCTFDAGSLYECSGANATPSLLKKCLSNNCVKDKTKCEPEHNINPCECYGKGNVCGATFPAQCNLESGTLYFCGGKGEFPKLLSKCESNICQAGNYECDHVPPIVDCICSKTETICSDTFPPCSLIPQSLYDCVERREPELLYTCYSGICTAGNQACDVNECQCTAEQDLLCGSSLPGTCGYNPNSLYFCADVGAVPTEYAKCDAAGCDAATSACKTDPCACASSDPACGSSLETKCGLDPSTLYNCAQVGAKPEKAEVCTAGCTKGAKACNVDSCICTKAELKCGASFDGSCGLNKDTLYECTAKGAKLVKKETCIVGGCLAGTAACIPDPCKRGSAPSTCGSDFDVSCGFNKDTIYECSDPGAIPKPETKCGASLCKPGDVSTDPATCKPDCTCKAAKDTCGVDFPVDCGLKKDTLYTCASIGAPPKPKEVCSKDGCKTGTGACYVDPCACKPVGEVCGKNLCITLKPDTIYICSAIGGPAVAKPGGDCDAGMCNGGKCGPNTCICPDDGPFCGNELNCPGLNPDLYYSCKKDKNPFPFDRCKNGKPTTGKCLCNDGNNISLQNQKTNGASFFELYSLLRIANMCSTYFPFECGYDQNQVMDCPDGAGDKPVTAVQCGVGKCANLIKCDLNCKCVDATAKCGKHFDVSCGYKEGSIYTCSGTGATPVEGKACGSADLCNADGGIRKCLGECRCEDVDPACSRVFPTSCKYLPGHVYRSDYAGATPESPKACPIPCNPQNGPDKCGLNLYSA